MKSILIFVCCLCLFFFVLAKENEQPATPTTATTPIAEATKVADDYIKEAYEKLAKDPKTMDFLKDYGMKKKLKKIKKKK